jgi:hypothetical protein
VEAAPGGRQEVVQRALWVAAAQPGRPAVVAAAQPGLPAVVVANHRRPAAAGD